MKGFKPTYIPTEGPGLQRSLSEVIKDARSKASDSVANFRFNEKRVQILKGSLGSPGPGKAVVYWMSRDQRIQDNWALLYAQRLALKWQSPLHICFCLVSKFMDATIRHFRFMLGGLREVEQESRSLNLPFHLLRGDAKTVLVDFVKANQIGAVVTDFSPLRVPSTWVRDVSSALPEGVALFRVDAHNVVPAWVTSNEMETAAYKIRAKLEPRLEEFLTPFPPVIRHPFSGDLKGTPIDWQAMEDSLEVDRSVVDVKWAKPGTEAGLKMLETFISDRLADYGEKRNEPNAEMQSNLSPWFHFGQVAPHRAILEVKKYEKKYPKSYASFINEALVWRELAENFCYYNQEYDRFAGAPGWAKESLLKHSKDERQHVYTLEDFDEARTHDDIWNASQIQMKQDGKLHGFLRMYWAKKILEWTADPEEAVKIALYLNDRYNLDGRDPNGFGGVMWSICGVHDRPFDERPIVGKIRCMTYFGCTRKFDVKKFVQRYGAKAFPPKN